MDFIEPCFGIGHNLSLICQMTSEDIKHQLIIIITNLPNIMTNWQQNIKGQELVMKFWDKMGTTKLDQLEKKELKPDSSRWKSELVKLSIICLSLLSPWYNHTGWLGTKHGIYSPSWGKTVWTQWALLSQLIWGCSEGEERKKTLYKIGNSQWVKSSSKRIIS